MLFQNRKEKSNLEKKNAGIWNKDDLSCIWLGQKSAFLNHIIALHVPCMKKTPIQPLQKKIADFVLERKHWQILWHSGNIFSINQKPTQLEPKIRELKKNAAWVFKIYNQRYQLLTWKTTYICSSFCISTCLKKSKLNLFIPVVLE